MVVRETVVAAIRQKLLTAYTLVLETIIMRKSNKWLKHSNKDIHRYICRTCERHSRLRLVSEIEEKYRSVVSCRGYPAVINKRISKTSSFLNINYECSMQIRNNKDIRLKMVRSYTMYWNYYRYYIYFNTRQSSRLVSLSN